MDRWREAGRLGRKEDDALWERFRAAQDSFFKARDAHHAASDAERDANLQVKLAIIKEAEALLPVSDIAAARAKLRELGEKWSAVGYVPRKDMDRVESRMKAVEDAVRSEEERSWRKSNPETIARVTSMTTQLEALIAGLEKKLVKVRATGDQTAISALEEDIAGRKGMLETLQESAERGFE
jgi:HSP20 family molecular chaperone IbpA